MNRFIVVALLTTLGGCATKPESDAKIGMRSFVPAPVPNCNYSSAAASEHGIEARDIVSAGLLAMFAIAATATHSGAAFSNYHGPGEIRGLLLPTCNGLCC